jgi:hypothetical protein
MLSLQFIQHHQLAGLSSDRKINKLLKLVKEENILLLEGQLSKEEETELIKKTMEQIKGKFKGIEISTIDPEENKSNAFINKIKKLIYNYILREQKGFTIIGPASIIKEIKRDPNKIQLLTNDNRRRRR